MPDTDTAEIKINLADSFTDVQASLGLGSGKDGALYFLDDLTPGLPQPLPLLHNGIVLRLRSKGNKADVTVKLRPCRRSQLRSDWVDAIADGHADSDVELKAEQDWSGARHSLAVSAVATMRSDDLSAAVDAHRPSSLFDPEQFRFLHDCGAIFVNPEQLAVLGPIAITRWQDISFGEFELNAERWRLGALDVLELSIVSPLAQAEARQSRFLQAVTAAGLSLREETRNKTELFLETLAEMHGEAP